MSVQTDSRPLVPTQRVRAKGRCENWVDLVDPTREQIEHHLPTKVHSQVLEQLLPVTGGEHASRLPRPKLESHGDYVFGVFLVAVAVNDEDCVYYQEIDIVLTRDALLTVQKTPAHGRPAYDVRPARAACCDGDSLGMTVYRLVDDIAERFLTLTDNLVEEIEEVEEGIHTWSAETIRKRVASLRHDMLQIRRILSPTRDALRSVGSNQMDLADDEVFTPDVDQHFNAAYDKLLRATDGLELARDLLAGARDYHQAQVANDQNEVMKRLTVIASILLLPMFIVGLYGQNFSDMPELHWFWGYSFSWGLIVISTVGQLLFFRWKKWI